MNALDERLAGVLTPLREHLGELEGAIEESEAELAELRSLRRRIATAVNALDPPPPPPKKNPKGGAQVSEKTLLAMKSWLYAREVEINEAGGFWVSMLYEDPSFTAAGSEASIRNAVATLHEQGVIALDRVAQGGRRIYKVVTA